MKFFAVMTAVAAVLSMNSAMAGSGSGGINIPGWGSAQGSGSSGSTVKSSTIRVGGNKANDIAVGGGSGSGYGVTLDGKGTANVNSLNIENSKVTDSKILIEDNKATGVKAWGGATANVNSVNIH